MLAMLDANGLYCARRIVGLDVPEQKKGNQKFLLKFLLRKLNSERETNEDGGRMKMETNEDGGASWFQKLHDHLSKYFQPGGQVKFHQKLNYLMKVYLSQHIIILQIQMFPQIMNNKTRVPTYQLDPFIICSD